MSAYTLNGSGGWDALASVPASWTVTPALGSTAYFEFRVALSDLTGYVDTATRQVRLGAQEETTYSTYDYLPDAWGVSRAPGDLILVGWPLP